MVALGSPLRSQRDIRTPGKRLEQKRSTQYSREQYCKRCPPRWYDGVRAKAQTKDRDKVVLPFASLPPAGKSVAAVPNSVRQSDLGGASPPGRSPKNIPFSVPPPSLF